MCKGVDFFILMEKIVRDEKQRGEKCCIFAADLGERSVATAYLLLIRPTNTDGMKAFLTAVQCFGMLFVR